MSRPSETSAGAPSLGTIVKLIRRLWPLLRVYRWQFLSAFAAITCDSLLMALRPWPLKVIVDRVLTHKHTRVPFIADWLNKAPLEPINIVYGACAAMLIIAVLTGVFTWYFTSTMGHIGHSFVYSLRCHLFAHLQRLGLRFHDKQRTGDLTMRLTSDAHAIQDVVSSHLVQFLSNTMLLLAMLSMMLWLNWQFALAALSVAPLLFLVVLRYTGRIKRAHRDARRSDGLLTAMATESLAALKVVQGLSQERQQEQKYYTQTRESLAAHLEGTRFQSRVAPLVDILAACGVAIVMWYGATRVMAGELTTGDVIVFFAYVTNLYAPMKALAKLNSNIHKATIGAERIADVLFTEPDVRDSQNARAAPRFRGQIEFRNLCFEYHSGVAVLRDLNLKIQSGERVAIVGSTGAGKTTLISLIPRLFDPQSGGIFIDGVDVREYTLKSVRDQIGLVLQDSLLFSGTALENIAFGRPDATIEQIHAASEAAFAHEFISQMPDGYHSLVSERGSSLSGGQKQRIAIARAILRDSPILILDEPTSGLDSVSERMVMKAIERVSTGRTTLIIAHRLSTVRFADRVIVLDRGQLSEQGTHIELMSRGGRYASFVNEGALTGSGV